MADHTPGPWSVYVADDSYADGNIFVQTMTGRTICGLHGNEANARLIAAAPDLLEALQEINDWLVCACIVSAEDMAQSFPDMQHGAAIAIARATGEK